MSQTGAHSQWRAGASAAVTLVLGYLVESGGRYTLSSTGPADAYLHDTGDGRLHIATSGTQDATIYATSGGTRYSIFR